MTDLDVIIAVAEHYADKATGNSSTARLHRAMFSSLAATARGEYGKAIESLAKISGETQDELRESFRTEDPANGGVR